MEAPDDNPRYAPWTETLPQEEREVARRVLDIKSRAQKNALSFGDRGEEFFEDVIVTSAARLKKKYGQELRQYRLHQALIGRVQRGKQNILILMGKIQ